MATKAMPDITCSLYNGKHEAKYFDKSHRYTIDGVRKKSVTGILGVAKETDILIMWAVKMARLYLLEIIESGGMITIGDVLEACTAWRTKRDTAAGLGTQVHDWIETYVKAQQTGDEEPELPTDEKVLNGVTGFLSWVGENDIEFLDSEFIVYSEKYDYTGKPDAVAKVNGLLTLVDYKTGSVVDWSAHAQVSAYLEAIAEEKGKNMFKNRVIVQISKDTGEVTVHDLGMEQHELDFKAFLGALAISVCKSSKPTKK